MRLLLVDDDRISGSAVQKHLNRAGYAVDWVLSDKDFAAAIEEYRYDILILDLESPDKKGEALLQRLQQSERRLPVIVLIGSGSIHDRVRLLDMGADGVLIKPFDLGELTARVRSFHRRLPADDADAGAVAHGELKMFPLRLAATWCGQYVPLTHREFSVLDVLVRRKHQVLSRDQIEEALCGFSEELKSNAIDVYIHVLRRKLYPSLIRTIRGVGYQLAPEQHA
jgi:two-component system OmpR family response regulator/two-component system response regulator QseB